MEYGSDLFHSLFIVSYILLNIINLCNNININIIYLSKYLVLNNALSASKRKSHTHLYRRVS